ncbi:prepilin-type cleavage/methylation domain-containing protein [Acidovorax sp. GW101-3H11]|uniref:PilW family protein n=1 Tax=Acidovorax sp. GW101-3H11 TaxID=1813946 RepID=UPI000ACE6368|nr:prepilin-type cleavage/methylation domain-containing protein [Acidovorax sp. GW101-3H11]
MMHTSSTAHSAFNSYIFSRMQSRERGATLIELLVGLTIGLLTISVGLGAIMVSRGVTTTVNDTTTLQQQASYAFRVIGQQLRQAGGRPLNTAADPRDAATFVQPTAVTLSGLPPIAGLDAPTASQFIISMRYVNASESIYPSPPSSTPIEGYLIRDCLGSNSGIASAPIVLNELRKNGTDLECSNSTGNVQPIISNLVDLRIRYLQQKLNLADKQPQFRYASAANLGPTDWPEVYGIEVCLELEGEQVIDTVGASYTKCDGTTATRGNKLRMVFKNIFHIRNHAWPKAIS